MFQTSNHIFKQLDNTLKINQSHRRKIDKQTALQKWNDFERFDSFRMNSFPDEVWHFNILPYLNLQDCCLLKCISKRFYKIINGYLYNMKSLHIDEGTASMLTEEGLGFIFVQLKMLQSVSLRYCWKSATEKNLLLLSNRCNSLKSLVTDHCSNVTDYVISNLSERCRKLEYLNISYCYNASVHQIFWF